MGVWAQLLLAQALILGVSTSSFRYVTAKSDSSSAEIEPRLTIQQFADASDRYFTTWSRFVFLPGNHSLQTALRIRNVPNITLRGLASTTRATRVLLGANATIAFEAVSDLRIERLMITVLATYVRFPRNLGMGLVFVDSDGIRISDCSFRDSTAIVVKLVATEIAVLNCTFAGNTEGVIDTRRRSSIVISGSVFVRNSQGVITSHDSTVTVRVGNIFKENGAKKSDGVIRACDSNVTVSTGNTFTGNMAKESGGVIRAWHGNVTLEGRNIFSHNAAGSGGVIHCTSCVLTMTGSNTFFNNSAGLHGGAVGVAGKGMLKLEFGTSTFIGNTAWKGGAVTILGSRASIDNRAEVVLDGNKAKFGGGMHIYNSHLDTSGRGLKCSNNVATEAGGGVSIGRTVPPYSFKRVNLSGVFTNNSAQRGGALWIGNQNRVLVHNIEITSNSAGAVFIHSSTVTFKAGLFTNNTGTLGGGINAHSSTLFFEGSTLFEGNTALNGGAMYLLQGKVNFDGVTMFAHNSAGSNGGALYATNTAVNLTKTAHFTFNSAENGGAIYLRSESYVNLGSSAHFVFSFNTALQYGGGMYHLDSTDPTQCSYDENVHEMQGLHCSLKHTFVLLETQSINISSYHDSAGTDGSFIYGGLLDRCQLTVQKEGFIHNSKPETMLQYLLFHKVAFTVASESNRTQAITSQPYGLCFCDSTNQTPDCTGSRKQVTHRGQKFTVWVLATAQGSSSVGTSVTAITSAAASLKLFQNPQTLPPHCSSLTYNLYSTEDSEQMVLYPDGPCNDSGYAKAVVTVTLLPCPDGFTLASNGRCVCEERLQRYNASCNIDDDVHLTKKAGAGFWMGFERVNGSYEGLILYGKCPVEYCKTDEVNMTAHDLDIQCADGRVGLLCGGCAENNSLLLGGSTCRECSNVYIALIIPFAAAGMALVAFLSILRLTVATGMLNSLILYANIIQVNRKLFFPANTVNILTVFIAWMNLDLGFETCFYNGMDAFAQTCLQFVFPVYVWVIISVIILTSRHSITVSKLIGHNPIAVLATLLLMSYNKVLKIIIEVYSSAKLDYPRNRTVAVWLKDANVPYLESGHLALTVVTSLVLTSLFLPYTFLLLLGHRLYRVSGRRYLRWFNRMKPLLDSYYAPYKISTRYWTGFLLPVRCTLYITNSFVGAHESLTMILLTFTAIGFGVGLVHQGRIYSSTSINVLELSVYMNLIMVSALTLANTEHLTELVYFLVGVVLATMVGVMVVQFHTQYTAKSALWLKLRPLLFPSLKRPAQIGVPTTNLRGRGSADTFVSKTVIDLREPLLETY